MNFNILGHQIGDAYRGVVNIFSGVSKESKFESDGTLTPEEFVRAGDQLVFKFPTWKWSAASSKSLEKPFLPKDKQFLITRGVPCPSRVRDLDHVLATTSHMDDAEGGWLVAGITEKTEGEGSSQALNIVDNFLVNTESTSCTASMSANAPPDLSEFADLDNALLGSDGDKSNTRCPVVIEAPQDCNNERSYDLSITWDKYYQTPRLWLFGYDRAGNSLTDEQIYQDVLSEYVTKTVTVDSHPFTGIRTASIHPCQHAKMMLKVIHEWKSNNHPVRPDLSLFVFLKFISGVVPTINYDFTMDIEM
jgi:ubiquitin-like-conjugating enzyme ATG3